MIIFNLLFWLQNCLKHLKCMSSVRFHFLLTNQAVGQAQLSQTRHDNISSQNYFSQSQFSPHSLALPLLLECPWRDIGPSERSYKGWRLKSLPRKWDTSLSVITVTNLTKLSGQNKTEYYWLKSWSMFTHLRVVLHEEISALISDEQQSAENLLQDK